MSDGIETWEQRARACAAEFEEVKKQNEILIIQASENEIKIEGLEAHIRDLEAQLNDMKPQGYKNIKNFTWGGHP